MEAIGTILSFVSDPRTLCRFACTCQDYAGFVSESDSLWKNLYLHFWKRGKRPEQHRTTLLWRNSCVLRYQHDALAAMYLNRMANSILCARQQDDDTGTLLAVAQVWVPDDDTWLDLMELGVDVLESCLRMHRNVAADLLASSFRDKCVAYVAAMAAYHLELASCFHECHGLYQNPLFDDDELVEKYAILIMKSHLTMDEFLSTGCGASTIERQVTVQLDDIASMLLARLDAAEISVSDDRTAAMTVLSKLYFCELGFQDSMFAFRHVLLDRALQHKNGNPMTNAIILKSICRRVGIRVDIICYRKFMLLGVPSTTLPGGEPYDQFFNVMTHHSISPAECQAIAERIGYDWRSVLHAARSSYEVLHALVDIQLLTIAPYREKSNLFFQVRNTLTWRAFLPMLNSILSPPNIPYEPCPELAGQLDDGAQI